MIRVTIWYEATQERGEILREFAPTMSEDDFANFSEWVKASSEKIHAVYPKGLIGTLAETLGENTDFSITTTDLYQPEYGLPDELLSQTDVLVWWSHISQDAVPDELVKKIVERVHRGMGFVCLHSGHKSKPFMSLLGSSGTLKWREGDFCRLWTVTPTHPIVDGIPEMLELSEEEMYGEPFDVAKPDDLVMLGWYRGGEVFRSLCTWTRGYGKIVYFQPGHETSPSYHNPWVVKIIGNAIRFAAPSAWREMLDCPNILESPESKYQA